MKIMCACQSGLGSSFLVEMNVKEACKNLGIEADVIHGALYECAPGQADLFVTSQDLIDEVKKFGDVVGVKNLMSVEEIQEKLKEYFDNNK